MKLKIKPFYLEDDIIILRDKLESDFDDYLTWHTKENEWMKWDAPWEKEKYKTMTIEEISQEIRRLRFKDISNIRTSAEICLKDTTHIGWVGSYFIDKEEKKKLAIGIIISAVSNRGNGVGTKAFKMWTDYLIEARNLDEIYFSTWSGNKIMINTGKKCGFKEFKRDKGIRVVDGEKFDKVLFKLIIEKER